MPVVFRYDGYRFHFFSNEGEPREPPHIHVTKGKPTAKFWLRPEVNVAYNKGFPPRVLAELSRIIEARREEMKERGMTTSPEPTAVRFDDYSFWVDLDDGRTLGIPLAWFPRLLHATPQQREQVSLSRAGLHWEEIDEDISIAGLLAGRGDQTQFKAHAA